MGNIFNIISNLLKDQENSTPNQEETSSNVNENQSVDDCVSSSATPSYNVDDKSWVKDFLLLALHELNVKCTPEIEYNEETKEPDYTSFNFEFQAGQFTGALKWDMNVLHFTFPHILQIKETESNLVPILKNEFNKSFQEYRLFTTFESDENNDIIVHVKAGLAIYSPDYAEFKEYLVRFLSRFFAFAREITDRFHELQNLQKNGKYINVNNTINKEQEKNLIIESERWMTNSKTTFFGPDIVYHLLENELHVDVFALKKIWVMNDESDEKNEVVFPTDEELISIALSHKNSITNIVFTFGCNDLESDELTEEVFASLEPLSELNNHSRVRATFTIVPQKGHPSRPLRPNGEPDDERTVSLILTQNNMSAANQQSEFDYVWEELQQKLSIDEDAELGEAETIISTFKNKVLARSTYWTAKSFYQKDVYQTIRHGLEAFRILSESYYNAFNENNKDEDNSIMDSFHENCMMLGTAYYEVGAYKMAIHFLDYPLSVQYAPDRIIEPYILTLLALRHHSVLEFIDGSIKKVKKMLSSVTEGGQNDDDDDDKDEEVDFDIEYTKELDKIILPQYRIIALINQRFYAHAKKELLSMITDPDFSVFAVKQLEIIKKIAPNIEPEE